MAMGKEEIQVMRRAEALAAREAANQPEAIAAREAAERQLAESAARTSAVEKLVEERKTRQQVRRKADKQASRKDVSSERMLETYLQNKDVLDAVDKSVGASIAKTFGSLRQKSSPSMLEGMSQELTELDAFSGHYHHEMTLLFTKMLEPIVYGPGGPLNPKHTWKLQFVKGDEYDRQVQLVRPQVEEQVKEFSARGEPIDVRGAMRMFDTAAGEVKFAMVKKIFEEFVAESKRER